jgi:hypothetical protein
VVVKIVKVIVSVSVKVAGGLKVVVVPITELVKKVVPDNVIIVVVEVRVAVIVLVVRVNDVEVTVIVGEMVVVVVIKINVVPKVEVRLKDVAVTVVVAVAVVVAVTEVVTKMLPWVMVISVFSDVVETVDGVGEKVVTVPLITVGDVMVILVGDVIVGEKNVKVLNTLVIIWVVNKVVVAVRVFVPVIVVGVATLKTIGLRTVNVIKEVMKDIDGTNCVVTLVAVNVVVVVSNIVHDEVIITKSVVVTQQAHWSHGQFEQVRMANLEFTPSGAKHLAHPGGQQGRGADGHGQFPLPQFWAFIKEKITNNPKSKDLIIRKLP